MAREFCRSAARSEKSYGYVLSTAKQAGLIKKSGKGTSSRRSQPNASINLAPAVPTATARWPRSRRTRMTRASSRRGSFALAHVEPRRRLSQLAHRGLHRCPISIRFHESCFRHADRDQPRFAVHFPQIGEQRIVVQRVDARPAVIGRPLSRGSNPCSCPHEPLVSYRINRQLSGWNPPPLMMRAFGAHCHELTSGTGAISANQPEN